MLKRYLSFIANLSVNHSLKIISGIMILTLIMGYKASVLQLQSSYDYLLPNNNPRIEIFNQILNEFENYSNIFLLASGNEDSLRTFAYNLKPLLESFDEWVSNVHTHIPVEFLRKNALKLMTPDELHNFGEIFSDPNLVPFLLNFNSAFENTYLYSNNRVISKRDANDVVKLLDKLQLFISAQEEIMLETEAMDVGQKAVDAIIFGESLNFSSTRDMALIIIEPKFNMHISSEKLLMYMNGIEDIIDKTAIHYGIKAELAGPLVVARDHYTAFLDRFLLTAILSLACYSLILILFFRKWSIPLICIITLIVGVIWTLGIYSSFMSALNLSSILALLVIILLGIGNCVLLISGFLEKCNQGFNIKVSMQETLQRYGSGVFIGGIIVGLCFLTLIFSEIKVYQELGLMAGIGIVTTMLVTVSLLPAILIILEKLHSNVTRFYKRDISFSSLGKGVQLVVQYRWFSIIVIIFTTAFLLRQAIQIPMDTNVSIRGLQHLDTINVENTLIKTFGISSNLISLTTDNLDSARNVTYKAREYTFNGLVESISDYLPDEDFYDQNFHYIRELRRNIKSRQVRKQLSSYDMNMYHKEIARLEANIIELQEFALVQEQSKIYEKTIQLVGDGADSSGEGGVLTQFINALDTDMDRLKLTYLQEQFSSAFKSTIFEMANTEPLNLHNLPEGIKSRFVGANNNIYRINIYPSHNLWDDITVLQRIINELSLINTQLTGWSAIFDELKDRIFNYASPSTNILLLSMLLLLIIGLNSFKYSLFIMLSLATGCIWFIGVLKLLNIPLNLMTIGGLPIIISVGMTQGIHILQRWKQEKNLDTVYRSTGKAIIFTTSTILFMTLPFWFLDNICIANVMSILLIGLGCSMLSHILILPLLLSTDTIK